MSLLSLFLSWNLAGPFKVPTWAFFQFIKVVFYFILNHNFCNIFSSDISIIHGLDLHFLSSIAVIFPLISFSFSQDSSKFSYVFILQN